MRSARTLRVPTALLGLAALGSSPACGQDASARIPGPPAAPREFRAAWIATVNNIDWPSRKGLSTGEARDELRELIARAHAVGLNALIFQVRPNGDALYASPLEPWSEWLTGKEGRAPDPLWDPLGFAVDEAHARGMELHAWLNPYRARHVASKTGPASGHIQARHPDVVHAYGGHMWMDPGEPVVQDWTLRVVLDIVRRYDVDGIHFDDYFYPYPDAKGRPFPDDRSWARVGRRSGLDRDDWRRRNVDDFVERLEKEIHRVESYVRFGISPFGIWRPGHPKGITGMDQYARIYADPRRWLREGFVDYLVPQLYWPIDQRAQAYVPLQRWWVEQNVRGRHLWIGNNASKTLGRKGWPDREILDQIARTRAEPGAGGNVLFSAKTLDTSLGEALRTGPWARPALPPASPWLDGEPPGPVVLDGEPRTVRGTLELRWHPDPEVFVRTLYLQRTSGGGNAGDWEFVDVVPGARRSVSIPGASTVRAVALGAVDRTGNESLRTVVDARRLD